MAVTRKKINIPRVNSIGNLDKLPLEFEITTSRMDALLQIAGGIVLFVTAYLWRSGAFNLIEYGSGLDQVLAYAPIALALGGLYFVGTAILKLIKKTVVKIGNGQVEVQQKGLLGSRNWSEPLDAFQGVSWREIKVNQKKGQDGVRVYTYNVVELKHENPKKALALHVTRVDGVTRAIWEGLAKLLEQPAIDQRGGVTSIRATEDLDKTIKDLAMEGKIEAEWDDSMPPPAGLEMKMEGKDSILVIIHSRRIPQVFYGFALVFGSVIFLSSLFNFALFGILMGAGFVGGAIWMWKYEQKNPRTVKLTRDQIEIRSPTEGTGSKPIVIQHDSIETVNIRPSNHPKIFGSELAISSDQGEHITGSGLSQEGLEWFRRLIHSAIANA